MSVVSDTEGESEVTSRRVEVDDFEFILDELYSGNEGFSLDTIDV
jgi:hypothetical protein